MVLSVFFRNLFLIILGGMVLAPFAAFFYSWMLQIRVRIIKKTIAECARAVGQVIDEYRTKNTDNNERKV